MRNFYTVVKLCSCLNSCFTRHLVGFPNPTELSEINIKACITKESFMCSVLPTGISTSKPLIRSACSLRSQSSRIDHARTSRPTLNLFNSVVCELKNSTQSIRGLCNVMYLVFIPPLTEFEILIIFPYIPVLEEV